MYTTMLPLTHSKRVGCVILLVAALSEAFSPRFVKSSALDHGTNTIRPHLPSSSSAGEHPTNSPTTLRQASPKSTEFSTRTPAQEFAYQELRAQLQADAVLQDKQALPTAMITTKRRELFQYCKTLLAATKEQSTSMPATGDLIGSSWVLAASVAADDEDMTTAAGIPKGATIQIDFASSSTLNYALVFPGGGAAGLERITAQCTYERSPPGSSSDHLLEFVYDKISFDAFGLLKQFPIGLFGLLKGRGNRIYSKYWDETLWIEEGVSEMSGRLYYNVYARQRSKES